MNKKKNNWFQLSQRHRLSLLPNLYSMEAVTSVMKDFLGYTYKRIVFTVENRLFHIFVEEKDLKRVENLGLKTALRNPNIIHKAIVKIKKWEKPFIAFCKKIHDTDLKRVSNKRLNAYYQRYYQDYKKIYGHYFSILTMENSVRKWLIERIREREKNKNKCLEYFSILSLNPKAMVSQEERRKLLKIAVMIKKKDIGKFKRNRKIINLIKKHQKEFFWVTRDYEDPILTKERIIEKLRKELEGSPQKELLKINSALKEHPKKIRILEKKLKLKAKEKAVFKLMRDGLYLKELRKTIVSKSLYYLDGLLIEIGRRTHLTLQQMRNILPHEILPALKGKDFSKILNERIKLCVCIVSKGKSEVLIGKKTEKWQKILLPMLKRVKVISGFAASYGRAKGKVRIVIHPSDLSKVKKKDILVTIQAVPSFAPVFKKITGVVADGGTGITSHTATLAREANIPCLTGCKIATKVLKDEDLVEVDAEKEIVRKL